jgi:pyruvate ferredoxin oxidoreductase delta subunit
MSKWDVSNINEWKCDDFPRGAVIKEAGNSEDYVTGGWRSERPWRDAETCTQCLLCWINCPDSSITIEDEKVVGFDLEHCKGCGICAQICPVKCISMSPEGCELPEVK